MFDELINLADEIGRLESSINAGYTDKGLYGGELEALKAQFNRCAGGLMRLSTPPEFVQEDSLNNLWNNLYG